jgi:hypothetical protein
MMALAPRHMEGAATRPVVGRAHKAPIAVLRQNVRIPQRISKRAMPKTYMRS